MTNPWLTIPAADYEAHMSLPEVAQAQAINRLFAQTLGEYAPASVAVLGCTTGNGFEHIDPAQTQRVVGVDINGDYLAIARQRHGQRLPNLELIKADVASPDFCIEPVEMIFAALVFEYVDLVSALKAVAAILAPGGVLVAVLQLPSETSHAVTPTPYTSLRRLAPIMRLVPPHCFQEACANMGLHPIRQSTTALKQGKAFGTICCRR